MVNAAKKLVHGIEEGKLSEEAIGAGLAHESIDIHPQEGMALKGKVELLVEHFRTLPVADLADCDNCGAPSAVALPCCPFCGEGGDVKPAGSPVEPEAGEDRDDDAEGGDSEEGRPGDDEPEHDEHGVVLDPENLPPAAPTEPTPLVDKKAAKAAKKAEKEAGKAAAAEAKKAKKANAVPRQSAEGAALTTPPEAKIPAGALAAQARPDKMATIAMLDKDVAEVRALDHEMNGYSWRMAQKLCEIAESQRFKLRLTAEGKIAYTTFEQFANAELDITREHAETLMRGAKRFSESEFTELGITKIRTVISAPPALQAKALEAFKSGASRRDVERMTKPNSKAKDLGAKGKKREPKAAEKGKITVALAEGRFTIKAFNKPEKKGEETARAKQIAKRPYGTHDLTNDVRMFVEAAYDANGEIVFKVEFHRIEE